MRRHQPMNPISLRPAVFCGSCIDTVQARDGASD